MNIRQVVEKLHNCYIVGWTKTHLDTLNFIVLKIKYQTVIIPKKYANSAHLSLLTFIMGPSIKSVPSKIITQWTLLALRLLIRIIHPSSELEDSRPLFSYFAFLSCSIKYFICWYLY